MTMKLKYQQLNTNETKTGMTIKYFKFEPAATNGSRELH